MKGIIYIIFSIILLTILMVSCDKGPLKTNELIGLNDTAFYTFERYTDNVISVNKKEYMFNPFYSIVINQDTLSIGQDFKGYIGAYRNEYKIVIDSPTKQVIEGTFQEPASGQPRIPQEYTYKTISEGRFSFSGHIEMDTLVVPFEYNFIVVKE